jgi:site-specific recombinase XerD
MPSATVTTKTLELYFRFPSILGRHRAGSLGPYVDGLAAAMRERGYSRQYVRVVVCAATRFGEYLRAIGIGESREISDELAARFCADVQAQGPFRHGPRAIRMVLEHLRRDGVIPRVLQKPQKQDPGSELLRGYEKYLADVRGLVASTIRDYSRGARRFLHWARQRHRRVQTLRGRDVLAFIGELAGARPTRCWRNRLTSHTRLFLRFLRWEGVFENDLARAVPKLRFWRLGTVPRHLSWDDVRKLVDGIDTSTPTGKRDKAVLLLIAILGMRGEEVRTLELKHVAWRAGEIRLPRTKTQRAKALPLPREVGAALADYVLHGRPQSSSATVVLRHAAPRSALSHPAAVSRIVKRCLDRARILAPGRPGVHLLRHSLATRMVNTGVPIKQIADVLGHRSINTTAIYTKVDMVSLGDVALPFPGERPHR